ncbi:MAG: CsbD family protein [Solirubrobacteraceae bacterium]|nr:MAG: CsbD family protein [Solirubrobacterales bacterium]
MTNKHIYKAKGRVKEAAGALTGDRHLKNEGRADQAKSSVKNAVNTLTGRKRNTKQKQRNTEQKQKQR